MVELEFLFVIDGMTFLTSIKTWVEFLMGVGYIERTWTKGFANQIASGEKALHKYEKVDGNLLMNDFGYL